MSTIANPETPYKVVDLSGTVLGPFASGFTCKTTSDLKVYLRLPDTADELLTLTTDYTVSGATPETSGYSVTLNALPSGDAAWPDGSQLVLVRASALTQAYDLLDTMGVKPSLITDALNRLTRLATELNAIAARASKSPWGEAGLDLASAAQRAGTIFAFDDEGKQSVARTLAAFDQDVTNTASNAYDAEQAKIAANASAGDAANDAAATANYLQQAEDLFASINAATLNSISQIITQYETARDNLTTEETTSLNNIDAAKTDALAAIAADKTAAQTAATAAQDAQSATQNLKDAVDVAKTAVDADAAQVASDKLDVAADKAAAQDAQTAAEAAQTATEGLKSDVQTLKDAVDAQKTAVDAAAATVASDKTAAETARDDAQAAATEAVATLAGSIKRRGSFMPAAASGTDGFPTTGGSGDGGAIKANDSWIASADGYVLTEKITAGDMVIAKVDGAGQSLGDWDAIETNLGYNPADYDLANLTGAGQSVIDVRANARIAAALAAAQTVSGPWDFHAAVNMALSATGTRTDYLSFLPTDFGTGKPGLFLTKEATAGLWSMNMYDGLTGDGTLNFGMTGLTWNGSPLAKYSDVTGLASVSIINTASIATLAASSGYGIPYGYLQCRATYGDGGHGIVIWRSGDQSANVTADPQHAIWIPPLSDTSGASGAWERLHNGSVKAEWFGVQVGLADPASALDVHNGLADPGTATAAVSAIIANTTALQAAIDWCKGRGNEGRPIASLELPSGYISHFGINLDRAVRVLGNGQATTLYCLYGVARPGITVAAQYDTADYYTLYGAPPPKIEIKNLVIKHTDRNDTYGQNLAHGISAQAAVTNPITYILELENLLFFQAPGDNLNGDGWSSGFVSGRNLYINGAYRHNINAIGAYEWRFDTVDSVYAGQDGLNLGDSGGFQFHKCNFYVNNRRGMTLYDDAVGGGPGVNYFFGCEIDTNKEHGIFYDSRNPDAIYSFVGGNSVNNGVETTNTFSDVYVSEYANDNLSFSGGFRFARPNTTDPSSHSAYPIYFNGSTQTVKGFGSIFDGGDPSVSANHFSNDPTRVSGMGGRQPVYGLLEADNLGYFSGAGTLVASTDTVFDIPINPTGAYTYQRPLSIEIAALQFADNWLYGQWGSWRVFTTNDGTTNYALGKLVDSYADGTEKANGFDPAAVTFSRPDAGTLRVTIPGGSGVGSGGRANSLWISASRLGVPAKETKSFSVSNL